MSRDRLLLVPGLMCDARVWMPQIDALQSIADCIVVDLGTPDTLTGQAHAVIDKIGENPCALAGFSMGGIVALEVMRLVPSRISRLALWDTNPGADPARKRMERNDQIAQSEAEGLTQMTRDYFAPLYLGDEVGNRPDLVELLVAMAVDLGEGVFNTQMSALRDRHDNWPVLPNIGVPTLVGCGSNDQLCPVDRHKSMADRIPDAELAIIPESAHLPTLQQPAAVSAAMATWLEKGCPT